MYVIVENYDKVNMYVYDLQKKLIQSFPFNKNISHLFSYGRSRPGPLKR